MKALSRDSSGNVFAYLTALCSAAYYVSYVSRLNLGACMVEMVNTGFAPRTTVALALSACSITYGAGQIISGYMGDRYRPQNVMLLGFVLTAAMNLGVAFIGSPGLLVALWAVNGFAQALMWPPIVAILTKFLDHRQYSSAVMYVSCASAVGTVTVYTLTPVFITFSTFRAVFVMSGIMASFMGVIWKVCYDRKFGNAIAVIPGSDFEKDVPEKTEGFGTGAVFILAFIMLAIVLQGMLRDGVTNWMPTFVSESFELDSSSAILTGVLLPVFHIICSKMTARIYLRFVGRETIFAGTIFAVGAAAALLMTAASGISVLLTSVLTAVLVGCMHSVNYVLVCMVPLYFKKYGRISLISGVINSSTYLGTAVSTYGIALFSAAFGWRFTVLLWAVIAGLGMLVCFMIARRWRRFIRE